MDWLLRQDPQPEIVFAATSAKAHQATAPRYAEAGFQSVDLTPAHLGPMVCPPVNGDAHIDAPNVSGASWRIRGGMPILAPTPPRFGEPAFVLSAAQPGRIGVDLVASGVAQPLPRPIRLIACIS